jgi:hypothetical protein
MDLWLLLLQRLGFNAPDWSLVGRWDREARIQRRQRAADIDDGARHHATLRAVARVDGDPNAGLQALGQEPVGERCRPALETAVGDTVDAADDGVLVLALRLSARA